MMRVRNILGFIASGILILSSGAHSILGWKQLGGQLAAIPVPHDLILALRLGWTFGGAAMLTFGVVTAIGFARRFRGQQVAPLPIVLIGALYVAFGSWALIVSSFDPFFFIFVIPGILLLVAAPQGADR